MEIKKAHTLYYTTFEVMGENESVNIEVNNEWENNIKLEISDRWRSIEEEIEYHERIIEFLKELRETLKEA
jgi:hypothetical protein